MTKALVLCLISGSIAAFSGWYVQGLRKDNLIAQINAQHADDLFNAQEETRYREKGWQHDKDASLQAQQAELDTLRSAANRSKRESDSLRLKLTQANAAIATASRSAVNQYAATASELLGQCASEYQSMAATADGHASDIRMMQKAWPK